MGRAKFEKKIENNAVEVLKENTILQFFVITFAYLH